MFVAIHFIRTLLLFQVIIYDCLRFIILQLIHFLEMDLVLGQSHKDPHFLEILVNLTIADLAKCFTKYLLSKPRLICLLK